MTSKKKRKEANKVLPANLPRPVALKNATDFDPTKPQLILPPRPENLTARWFVKIGEPLDPATINLLNVLVKTFLPMACNPLGYGGYIDMRTYIRPTTHKGSLSAEVLMNHFRAINCSDVVGGHFLTPHPDGIEGDVGRGILIDIDLHNESEFTEDQLQDIETENLRFALACVGRCVRLGFHPLLYRSGKGYHLRVLFDRAVPSKFLRRFALWLDSFAPDILRTDVFPTRAEDASSLFRGCWARFPGRHPKREEYAAVFTGKGWAVGKDAVTVLALGPKYWWNNPELIPELPDCQPRKKHGEKSTSSNLSLPYSTNVGLKSSCGSQTENESSAVSNHNERKDDQQIVERARAYLQSMPEAISGKGGHNQTFKVANVLLHGFDLTWATSWNLLNEYNSRCQPPWSDSELRHKLESAKNVTNHQKARGHLRDKTITTTDSGIIEPRTDVANARLMAQRNYGKLKYTDELGWFFFDGQRWIPKSELRGIEAAKLTVQSMMTEAQKEHVTACKAVDKTAIELANQNVKWAKKSQNKKQIDAMLSLCRSETGIVANASDFDPLPESAWLFNCKNGTIDLRTGELRKHSAVDQLTTLADIEFDANATCPFWESTVTAIFDGNEGLVEFIQRLFGYGLTGDISNHIFPIFWGEGSNGKSLLIEVIANIFGPYAGKYAPKMLMSRHRGEDHPTERADLLGKRLMFLAETGEGKFLDESLVKEMTGDEKIKARFCRQDFFEFIRTHKSIMITNHRPRIAEGGHGIWRRVLLVPFCVRFWDK